MFIWKKLHTNLKPLFQKFIQKYDPSDIPLFFSTNRISKECTNKSGIPDIFQKTQEPDLINQTLKN